MAKNPQSNEPPDDYGITVEPERVKLDLDPHLQELILARRAGETLDPVFTHTTSDGTTVIDVIARLKDPDQAPEGLTVARKYGDIVTGTCDVDRLEAGKADRNVLSLRRATSVHPELTFSVHEIEGAPDQLGSTLDGRGGNRRDRGLRLRRTASEGCGGFPRRHVPGEKTYNVAAVRKRASNILQPPPFLAGRSFWWEPTAPPSRSSSHPVHRSRIQTRACCRSRCSKRPNRSMRPTLN